MQAKLLSCNGVELTRPLTVSNNTGWHRKVLHIRFRIDASFETDFGISTYRLIGYHFD